MINEYKLSKRKEENVVVELGLFNNWIRLGPGWTYINSKESLLSLSLAQLDPNFLIVCMPRFHLFYKKDTHTNLIQAYFLYFKYIYIYIYIYNIKTYKHIRYIYTYIYILFMI